MTTPADPGSLPAGSVPAGSVPAGAPRAPETGSTASGPGRVLVAVYGVLALAATGRSVYQIGWKLHEAPLPYLLSGLAAVVYLLATLALARGGGRWRAVAWTAVSVELAGVLVVGLLSIVDAGDFPEGTVWSFFGRDYGYVPLVLPFLGLLWLRRTGAGPRSRPVVPAGQ
jgi:hypothetical protein